MYGCWMLRRDGVHIEEVRSKSCCGLSTCHHFGARVPDPIINKRTLNPKLICLLMAGFSRSTKRSSAFSARYATLVPGALRIQYEYDTYQPNAATIQLLTYNMRQRLFDLSSAHLISSPSSETVTEQKGARHSIHMLRLSHHIRKDFYGRPRCLISSLY